MRQPGRQVEVASFHPRQVGKKASVSSWLREGGRVRVIYSVALCWRSSRFPDPIAPGWPLVVEVGRLKVGDPLLISFRFYVFTEK